MKLSKNLTAVGTMVVASLATLHPSAPAQDAAGPAIAVVAHIDSPALFTPDARVHAEAASRVGIVTRGLAGLRSSTIPFAIALDPVLCDELRLLGSPAAKQALATIRAIAGRHDVLKTTYSGARLTDIRGSEIAADVRSGTQTLQTCTGRAPREPFVPPGLSLPRTDIVQHLDAAGVRSALSAYAVPPNENRPRIVPATIAADGPPPALLGRRPEAPSHVVFVDLTEFGAIEGALTSQPDVRAVNIRTFARIDIIGGLIDPRTPVRPTRVRDVEQEAVALERLRSYTLSTNRLVAILGTARARLEASPDRVAVDLFGRRIIAEFRKVRLADGSITFTSRSGSLPVTVSNDATYPIRIRVEVDSPKLSFPRGAARVVVIRPPGDTVTFDALARSSGTFPVDVAVSIPRDAMVLDRTELTVRSTALNIPAVVLTAGGALFLVFWFGRRLRQRKSAAR